MITNPEEALNGLEELLGLKKGFIWNLLGEDDWSFVIKLHAVIESCINQVIVGRFPKVS